jgi:hypothetical protein
MEPVWVRRGINVPQSEIRQMQDEDRISVMGDIQRP